MTEIAIGAHVDQTDPLAEAQARGTTLVQFFLGDPQGYKGPEVRYAGGATGLRADAEAAGIDLYVHAPYIVNVATTNNRIRIPSRKLLQQHVDAAAEIGAKGLIVHGGHVNKEDDPASRLRQLAQGRRGDRPQGAAADREHRRRRQRDGPPSRPDRRRLGRDPAGRRAPSRSASASTPATPGPAASTSPTRSTQIRAITGRIDLVHANDSRDAFDSGADRHANFGSGEIDRRRVRRRRPRAAGAPVICETPGGAGRAHRRLRLAARAAVSQDPHGH